MNTNKTDINKNNNQDNNTSNSLIINLVFNFFGQAVDSPSYKTYLFFSKINGNIFYFVGYDQKYLEDKKIKITAKNFYKIKKPLSIDENKFVFIDLRNYFITNIANFLDCFKDKNKVFISNEILAKDILEEFLVLVKKNLKIKLFSLTALDFDKDHFVPKLIHCNRKIRNSELNKLPKLKLELSDQYKIYEYIETYDKLSQTKENKNNINLIIDSLFNNL